MVTKSGPAGLVNFCAAKTAPSVVGTGRMARAQHSPALPGRSTGRRAVLDVWSGGRLVAHDLGYALLGQRVRPVVQGVCDAARGGGDEAQAVAGQQPAVFGELLDAQAAAGGDEARPRVLKGENV